VAKARLGKAIESEADLAAARAFKPNVDRDMRKLHVSQ